MVNRSFPLPPKLALTLVLALSSLAAGLVRAEGIYRYEENGRVVYGDRAPSPVQGDGHTVLNRQGIVIRQVLGREARREAQERERQRELARLRDRTLLATFTTEGDLLRTREERLGMVDGLIGRLVDRITILSDRLAVVDERVRSQERTKGGKNALASLRDEQRSLRRKIESTWSLIDSKAVERGELADKFEADLRRYRELRAERD